MLSGSARVVLYAVNVKDGLLYVINEPSIFRLATRFELDGSSQVPWSDTRPTHRRKLNEAIRRAAFSAETARNPPFDVASGASRELNRFDGIRRRSAGTARVARN